MTDEGERRAATLAAYHEYCDACEAWSEELWKAFGERGRSYYRYTEKGHGEPGTPLRAAHDRFVEAGEKWRNLVNTNEAST